MKAPNVNAALTAESRLYNSPTSPISSQVSDTCDDSPRVVLAEVQLESPSQTAQLSPAPVEVSGPLRNYRVNLNGAELQLMRGEFHRHTEISGDGGNDGPLIDAYRYLIDAAHMDWGGCCDHDNGGGHEYFWWLEQKLTDAYNLGERYVPMFAYERSVRYLEGHRNVVFPKRGIRPLPRLPKMADDSPSAPAPDTQMLYRSSSNSAVSSRRTRPGLTWERIGATTIRWSSPWSRFIKATGRITKCRTRRDRTRKAIR
jgi:hypothetical protein